jgi:hypothetical protein
MVPFIRLAKMVEFGFAAFYYAFDHPVQYTVAGKPGYKMGIGLARAPIHQAFAAKMAISPDNDDGVFP